MFCAHELSTGGFIPGEVKLVLSLRLLAGGSYLDLALIYGVAESYTYDIFYDVMENWVCHSKFENKSIIEILEDDDERKSIVKDFVTSITKSVIGGYIGAIDGWLVKIAKSVGIPNSSNFLFRKGYFAINVQAICNKKKIFIWKSMLYHGQNMIQVLLLKQSYMHD